MILIYKKQADVELTVTNQTKEMLISSLFLEGEKSIAALSNYANW